MRGVKGYAPTKRTQLGIPCLHCTLNWHCWRVISTMQTSAYQDMYNIIPQVRASPLNMAPSNVMTAINLWETLIFYILRIKQLVPFPDEQASWPSLFPNCFTLCFNALMPTCNMAFNSGALLHTRTSSSWRICFIRKCWEKYQTNERDYDFRHIPERRLLRILLLHCPGALWNEKEGMFWVNYNHANMKSGYYTS